MSKHTPGPWKWSGEYTHPCGKPAWTLLGRHGLYGILTCDQGSAPQDLNDEANARLIAAAPEMFEALDTIGGLSRALRQGGPDPMDLQGLSDALEEAVDLANSLVAQIEGRA